MSEKQTERWYRSEEELRQRAHNFRFLVGRADRHPSPEEEVARRYLWDLMERCGAFHDPFDPSNERVEAHLCGQKAVGLEILADFMRGAPDVFAQMMFTMRAVTDEEETDEDDTD